MEKSRRKKCCTPQRDAAVSHQIEAIITVDERGQMVLPKETRARAGIRAGDKLALIGWRKGERVCCLSLIRVEEMAETIGELLSALTVSAPQSER